MTKPLRVLLVEDSEDDQILLERCLRVGGYEATLTRVETAEAMRAALLQGWDVVISDYHLPRFTAPEAYAVMTELRLDLPFIIVSGTVGEDAAVRAMKAGVHDYIVKGNLARLVPAIEREVREARSRAEQRKLREQLLISDRMASAGALAAGVAHEINNPLAVVAANLEFVHSVVQRLAAPPADVTRAADYKAWLAGLLKEIGEPLRDTRAGVTRIRDIVRDIKMFSRPQDDSVSAVDVRQAVESAIRMSWNELRHHAQVVKKLDDVPRIAANESRLGQVLLNLLVNAAQAMPEGRADANEIHVTARPFPGNRVVIEVRDTGVGIPAELLPRIFDPFFTTKPIGVGTGLGLAICHRIVTDLGGEISVESEVGKGTVFRVVLPAAPVVAQQKREVSLPPESGPRGRVLVVDDELPIGRTVQRILARYHDVVVVTSGREALQRIRSGERFDAILSDLMMPEVSGMELFEQLKTSAADQAGRVIFMTGGAFTARAREFLEAVPNPQVEKPFETALLISTVDEVVRRTAA